MLDRPLVRSKCKIEIFAAKSGYVQSVDAMKIAETVLALGGGRNRKEDEILPHVGVKTDVRRGDFVNEDDQIATMYFDKYEHVALAKEVQDAFAIADKKTAKKSFVLETVK